jgi:hypothetical protein
VADAWFQVKAGVSLAFNGGNMAFIVEQLLKQRHTEAKPELFAILLIEEPVLHAGEGYEREHRAPVARIEREQQVRRGGKSIHCGPIAAIRLHEVAVTGKSERVANNGDFRTRLQRITKNAAVDHQVPWQGSLAAEDFLSLGSHQAQQILAQNSRCLVFPETE